MRSIGASMRWPGSMPGPFPGKFSSRPRPASRRRGRQRPKGRSRQGPRRLLHRRCRRRKPFRAPADSIQDKMTTGCFSIQFNVDTLRQVEDIATELNLIGGSVLGDRPTSFFTA
jgi:hypothetical protein